MGGDKALVAWQSSIDRLSEVSSPSHYRLWLREGAPPWPNFGLPSRMVVYGNAAENSMVPEDRVKCPYLNPFWRGQRHGFASFLLPTRSVGSPLALRHVASQLAQAKRAPTARASHAPQAQAQACYRAQSVRGSDAQASLCPV